MLVIHPKDRTTVILSTLYKGQEHIIIDYDCGSNQLAHVLHHVPMEERIMLLGHGSDKGLYYRKNDMEEGFVDQSMLDLVKGLPVERFIPFADKFKDQFYLSHPGQYRMHYKDKFIRVTFFLVEKKRLLGAMFDDVTNPTIKRETVVKNAETVIQKSLETVQQIASLLGENAAETEIMLNSLIDAFSVHSSDGSDDFTMEDDRD